MLKFCDHNTSLMQRKIGGSNIRSKYPKLDIQHSIACPVELNQAPRCTGKNFHHFSGFLFVKRTFMCYLG